MFRSGMSIGMIIIARFLEIFKPTKTAIDAIISVTLLRPSAFKAEEAVTPAIISLHADKRYMIRY